MDESTVTVACCQAPLSFGDRQANLATLRRAVDEAVAAGAQVVVLPELATTGYCFASHDEVESLAESLDGPTLTAWRQWAAEHRIVLVGGFAERADDGRIHNSAAVVDPTGVRTVYRKVHLWDREQEWFVPGQEPPPVVDTEFGRIAVMVCYDLEFPEWVRLPSVQGAEMLCAPTNWPDFAHPVGERPSEVVKVQADAAVNCLFIAVCDRTGTERGNAWLGGSAVIGPDGYPLTTTMFGTDGLAVAEVDLAAARDKRLGGSNDVLRDRRPELYAVQDTAERG